MTTDPAERSRGDERTLRAVPEVATERLTIAQAVRDAMRDEMELDDRVLVLGEDVGVDGGVFRATDGLLEQFGPDRVIDTPLAESAIIGMSIGLAATGFRPVAEIQFMGFVYPAINQLFAHAARLRNRSRGRLQVPMVVRMPYGGGIHPPEHHSESYESLFLSTPGIKVVVPSNPVRRQGPADLGDPRRRSGAVHGAQANLPSVPRAGSFRTVHGSDRQGRGGPRQAPTSR